MKTLPSTGSYDRFTRRGLLKGALGLAATTLPLSAAAAPTIDPDLAPEVYAQQLRARHWLRAGEPPAQPVADFARLLGLQVEWENEGAEEARLYEIQPSNALPVYQLQVPENYDRQSREIIALTLLYQSFREPAAGQVSFPQATGGRSRVRFWICSDWITAGEWFAFEFLALPEHPLC